MSEAITIKACTECRFYSCVYSYDSRCEHPDGKRYLSTFEPLHKIDGDCPLILSPHETVKIDEHARVDRSIWNTE